MKFAVLGAGAVGCYFGGMLARAGHEVVLIGRPAHVAAIRAEGLRMQTRSFDERVKIGASTDVAEVAGAAVVLLCVKSTDTESAAQSLCDHLGAGTVVLSLQNGVDNAKRLRAVLGPAQPVAATVVYVATEMAGPGHLLHHGRGELVLEPGPWSEWLPKAFAGAGVPVELSSNVDGALWAKLIVNCAYNAMSAIGPLRYGRLVQVDGVRAVMDEVVRECLAVAAAEGVQVPGDLFAAVPKIAQTMAGQYSSTAQDLMRGRGSEIDHLNGHVVRRGRELGLPTPVNQALTVLVHVREVGHAERGS
jgi:2-dehydropantoate 2-reductase